MDVHTKFFWNLFAIKEYPYGKPLEVFFTSPKTLQTETSYVVSGKEINRDIESSGERNQL